MSEKIVSEQQIIDKILHAKIEEMVKFCGLTITDSLGVDVTDGLIHYMKLGAKEWLQQKQEYTNMYHMLQRKYALRWLLKDVEK